MCSGEELLLLSGDVDEVVIERSKLMRVEHRTRILRLRALMDGILF
jgi:hypothetical protein